MPETESDAHPSRGPAVAWFGLWLGFLIAALTVFDGQAGRVVTVITFPLAAIAG